VSAASSGRWRPLLLAGVWVGLAFQAKMLEAWLVLPALAVCYLLAAPGAWLQRVRRCGAMVLLAGRLAEHAAGIVDDLPAGVHGDRGARHLVLGQRGGQAIPEPVTDFIPIRHEPTIRPGWRPGVCPILRR
jgi:hypothetical protein